MPKARTLVDDFGYVDVDGTRLSHEKGTVVDLDTDRYLQLVDDGSVEPADGKSKAPAKDKPADGEPDAAPLTHRELDAQAKELNVTFPKKSNVAAKAAIIEAAKAAAAADGEPGSVEPADDEPADV